MADLAQPMPVEVKVLLFILAAMLFVLCCAEYAMEEGKPIENAIVSLPGRIIIRIFAGGMMLAIICPPVLRLFR